MTTGSNATAMPGLPGLGVMAVLGAMFWFGFAMFVRFPEPFGPFCRVVRRWRCMWSRFPSFWS